MTARADHHPNLHGLSDSVVARSAGSGDRRIIARRRRYTVFGQKGSGESGYLGAPAAISGAVNDAVSPLRHLVSKLPIRIAAIGDAIAGIRDSTKGDKQ